MQEENPYESPRIDSSPNGEVEPGLHLVPLALAITWGVFLFLAIPAVQRVPLFLRVASTLLTIGACSALVYSWRKLWHSVATAPILVALAFLQYLVWVFPSSER